jgi:hypothetical protein
VVGMDESHRAPGSAELTLWARFAPRSAAPIFSVKLFGIRLVHHLLVYSVVLLGSVYLALFIYAPMELL